MSQHLAPVDGTETMSTPGYIHDSWLAYVCLEFDTICRPCPPAALPLVVLFDYNSSVINVSLAVTCLLPIDEKATLISSAIVHSQTHTLRPSGIPNTSNI